MSICWRSGDSLFVVLVTGGRRVPVAGRVVADWVSGWTGKESAGLMGGLGETLSLEWLPGGLWVA